MNPYSYILQVNGKEYTAAQEAIKVTFLQQLAKTPLHDISVKNLCQQVPVARTTFYTYYNNIDDLLSEIEDGLIADSLKIDPDAKRSVENQWQNPYSFKEAMKFVDENQVTLQTLLVAQPDIRFIEKWKAAVKYHFWELLFKEQEIHNSGLILEMIASMAIAAYTYWLKNPQEVDSHEVHSQEIERIVTRVLELIEH